MPKSTRPRKVEYISEISSSASSEESDSDSETTSGSEEETQRKRKTRVKKRAEALESSSEDSTSSSSSEEEIEQRRKTKKSVTQVKSGRALSGASFTNPYLKRAIEKRQPGKLITAQIRRGGSHQLPSRSQPERAKPTQRAMPALFELNEDIDVDPKTQRVKPVGKPWPSRTPGKNARAKKIESTNSSEQEEMASIRGHNSFLDPGRPYSPGQSQARAGKVSSNRDFDGQGGSNLRYIRSNTDPQIPGTNDRKNEYIAQRVNRSSSNRLRNGNDIDSVKVPQLSRQDVRKARPENSNKVRTQATALAIKSEDAPDLADPQFAAFLQESKLQAEEDEKRRRRTNDSDEDDNLKRVLQESKAMATAQATGRVAHEEAEIDEDILRASIAVAKVQTKRRLQQQKDARRADEELIEAIAQSRVQTSSARQGSQGSEQIEERILQASREAAKEQKQRFRRREEERNRLERELAEVMRESRSEHQSRVEQAAAVREAERRLGNRNSARVGDTGRPNLGSVHKTELRDRQRATQSMSASSAEAQETHPDSPRLQSGLRQRYASTRLAAPLAKKLNQSSRSQGSQNASDATSLAVHESKGKEREKTGAGDGNLEEVRYYVPEDWELNARKLKEERDRRRAAIREAKAASLRNASDEQMRLAMAASLQDNPDNARLIDDEVADTPPPNYNRIQEHPKRLNPLYFTSDNGAALVPGFLRRITKKDLLVMKDHAIRVAAEKTLTDGLMLRDTEAKLHTEKMRAQQEAPARMKGADALGDLMREPGRTRAVAHQQPGQAPGAFRENFERIAKVMQSKKRKKNRTSTAGHGAETGVARSGRRG